MHHIHTDFVPTLVLKNLQSRSMKGYIYTSAVWEIFDLTVVVDDAGNKTKKVICNLFEGVTLAYSG